MFCFSDDNIEDINSTESLQYDFGTIEAATNQFSDSNKLGEGGFGAVFKVQKQFQQKMSSIIIRGKVIESVID